MTIKEALKKYSKELRKHSSSPALDIEAFLSFILNKPKSFLYAHAENNLAPAREKKLRQLISRRQKYEPVAYLTGRREFYGLEFKVNKAVLIPRPETEQLVEETIKYIKKKKLKSIADIGTGSGAIITAIAKNTNLKEYYATDISHPALKIARQNAHRHGLKKQITFLRGNLLKPFKNKKIDLIVANLPYLNEKEMKEPSIQQEPKKALAGGQNGLDKFREFFKQLKSLKYQPQIILLEIGWKQAARLKKLAPKNYNVKIKKDLCGRERVMVLERETTKNRP